MSKKRKKPKLKKDGTVDQEELKLYLLQQIRKPTAPPSKAFKDKKKYSRKKKHKSKED